MKPKTNKYGYTPDEMNLLAQNGYSRQILQEMSKNYLSYDYRCEFCGRELHGTRIEIAQQVGWTWFAGYWLEGGKQLMIVCPQCKVKHMLRDTNNSQ